MKIKYLVIRNQNHTFCEITDKLSVLRFRDLTSNTLVATDSDKGRTPPVGHSSDEKPPLLLIELDPIVVPLFVNER